MLPLERKFRFVVIVGGCFFPIGCVVTGLAFASEIATVRLFLVVAVKAGVRCGSEYLASDVTTAAFDALMLSVKRIICFSMIERHAGQSHLLEVAPLVLSMAIGAFRFADESIFPMKPLAFGHVLLDWLMAVSAKGALNRLLEGLVARAAIGLLFDMSRCQKVRLNEIFDKVLCVSWPRSKKQDQHRSQPNANLVEPDLHACVLIPVDGHHMCNAAGK